MILHCTGRDVFAHCLGLPNLNSASGGPHLKPARKAKKQLKRTSTTDGGGKEGESKVNSAHVRTRCGAVAA